MNQKVIGIIIGLMSIAVIGLVWLQMDLIHTSMRENEVKFNDNVKKALREVAERLEREERIRAENAVTNGYTQNRYTFIRSGSFKSIGTLNGNYTEMDPLIISKGNGNSQFMGISSQTIFNLKGVSYIPLEERINPEQLNTIINEALVNNNIMAKPEYGVYSTKKKNFVIVNEHFVYNEDEESAYSFKNIANTDHRVYLFGNELPSPGQLMVYFPEKSKVVWSSLWLNLLGTILFAGIILSSFAYTIVVIFRQKKLGEMKNDFINNMTHEFKTPIATISLAADSITSPIIAGKPDKVSRFAGIIKQENKRMNSQVEKVLQMALIDKRDFSLKLTEVNLHDVVASAVENISLQVEKKEGLVSADIQATNPIVEGDVTHISNVINNLLDNANKYSPDKPEILVSTRNVGSGVEVIVKDRGIGMSKEARKHIFDKFYRVHTGNLHDVKGFGLGLSYVKAIMTAHKGQIDVKSELGKGSSFILHFPFRVDLSNN
ncbi:MAG: HAMP domain-containing histidine kinase [Saprospiraceae bacterium]|nr:HAMP domain-containing histidine kinase [Saprospiraceae bacterium]